MHSVELFDEALGLAKRLGYQIRQEFLGGNGGGGCQIRGQKWMFVDLGQSGDDQLDRLIEALGAEPNVVDQPLSPNLRRLLERRSAA